MDTNMEDKMYHQIQKSLSNNINENLFTSGKTIDKEKLPLVRSSVIEPTNITKEGKNTENEYLSESFEYISQPSTLPRAEYIRQAREACLRQLSNQSIRMMDTYSPEIEEQDISLQNKKKAKALKLFKDSEKALRSPWNRSASGEENSLQELASFQSIIIRTICAIVLFLFIFLIDKFEFSLGNFSKVLVREYITGNDRLLQLEEIVVSWLK